jgi:ribulose-5-phosphate 4-epimerase/fuculose-1-phosphate aldolase
MSGYKGVKFSTTMLGTAAPDDLRLEQLKKWCTFYHTHHLAPPYPGGSYGNLSYRQQPNAESFIITGTCMGLKENLENHQFVQVERCDMNQKVVYARGCRKPSSESMLHYAIYQQRPDVQAIFHGHGEVIMHQAEAMGWPITHQAEPYGTIELVESVLDILKDHHLVIMRNHGFLILGSSLQDAGARTQTILQEVLGVPA